MLPTKFWFICSSGYREEDFKKSANQKQELPVAAWCLLMDRDEMSNLYRGPSIDASYQVPRQMPSDGKSSHCLWQGELINLYYDDYENAINHQYQIHKHLTNYKQTN